MATTHIPITPANFDQTRVIERPDGFYWQDKLSENTYGPFPSLLEAVQDMKATDEADYEESGYEEGESLEQAEAELGISDWIDPSTGELAECNQPHIRDE